MSFILFQKMRKVLLLFVALMLTVMNVWGAVHHVRFKADNTSTETGYTTVNKSNLFEENSKTYINAIVDYKNVMPLAKKGVLIGSASTSNPGGFLKFSIVSGKLENIKKITIKSIAYNQYSKKYSFAINGDSPTAQDIDPVGEFTFTFPEATTINSVKLIVNNEKLYFSEIIFETEETKTLSGVDSDQSHWATYSNDNNGVFFLSPIEVKTATVIDGALKLTTLSSGEYKGETGTYVAKGTGVLLKSEQAEMASFYVIESDVDASYNNQNMLHASSSIISGNYDFYVFSIGENGLGFYWDTSAGATLNETWSGGAYLAVPKGTSTARGFSLEDAEEGIEQVKGDAASDGVYSLNGRYMGTLKLGLPEGIYVVNGQKMVIGK